MLRIERLDVDDWPRLKAIRLRALAEAPDAFWATLTEEAVQPDSFWVERLQADRVWQLVAVLDGQDVGLVVVAPTDGDDFGLYSMWAAPRVRGNGVADALVRAAIDAARREQAPRLLLEVADSNTAAVRLYARHHFEPTGRTGTLPAPRDHVTEHERARRLPPIPVWDDLLRPHVSGRKWLVAKDVLAVTRGTVQLLRELGAERCFALAGTAGHGEPPPEEDAESLHLGVTGVTDFMASIRACEAALRNLPPEVQARIDSWDPDGTARTFSTIFSSGGAIADRPIVGQRPPSWQILEDKTTVDALWDEIGVERSPCRVLQPAQLSWSAATALDEGHGIVLSGDSREGFNGGASYVRRIRTEAELGAAAAWFSEHCDRVRVMPFLEGIPCSIHGMVFPDVVLAFRPVEMVVLRNAMGMGFTYVGAASFWDAPPADLARMRRIAVATGEHLRRTVDYRGVFTVDGVLTASGFRPTELNPRFGAAIGALTRGVEGLPLAFMNHCVVDGWELDFDPLALEDLVMGASETVRSAGTHVVSPTPCTEERRMGLRLVDGRFERCPFDEADARLSMGPFPAGSHVFLRVEPDRIPIGPPFAPLARSALHLADEAWNLQLGPLEAAVEMRR